MFTGDVLQWDPRGLGCLEGERTGVGLDLELRDAFGGNSDWQRPPGQLGRVLLQFVFPQHLPGEIAAATETTDVVPLSCVDLDVVLVLPALPPGEPLAAVLALEDHVLLLSVHHLDVSAEGGVGPEVVGALRAAEGFLPSMDRHVIRQAGAVGESSGAELALELFKVWLVASLMNIETGSAGIVLTTDITVELLLTVSRPLVSVETLLLLSDVLALRALVHHRSSQVLLLDMSGQLVGLSVEEATDPADEL